MVNDILRNILLGITLAIPLGPASLAVIQTGLRAGFLRAWMTGIGVTLADTTYLLVVYFGLSGFMGIPAVKIAVWMLGALVLFYLGWQSLRAVLRKTQNLDSSNGNFTCKALSFGWTQSIPGRLSGEYCQPNRGYFLGGHLRFVDRLRQLRPAAIKPTH